MSVISANGTAYDLSGPEDAPTIVLVHGLGLRRATWERHVGRLSEQFRILNYDLHGHGESVAPPQKPTLSVYSQQLVELMNEVAIAQAAVVGFSLGGMINRRFAMDNPGRSWALGIFNSPHERGHEAQKIVEARAAASEADGPGANLDQTIERWFTPSFIEENADFIECIRSWVLANDAKTYAECRMVLAAGVKELIRPQTPIGVPSLVVTCEHDSGSTPDMSNAIASEIPGAEVVIIKELQHMGLTEKPDLFVEPLLAFLNKHKPDGN